MGGRLALIVGSECAAMGELGFTGELATGLYATLTEVGGWRSARSTRGPILNPTATQLVTAMDEAFAAAHEQQATLLIGFIGHGTATSDEDFFLLSHDSPALPTSHTAFHLTQEIRERLNRSALDGLVVLVDACETAQGVLGAARRWTDLLVRSAGRMELLVAAGDGPAYSGCFTRTLLSTFEAGLPARGENLLPSDLLDPVAATCTRQQPQHLSFSSGAMSVHEGDPGLWLVPNVARRRDALTGRPAAGFVDQLTRRLMLTRRVRETLADIVDAGGHRLRGVIGGAGVGKSTLLAMLIRPSLVDTLPVAPEYITAAVFLTVGSSVAGVAAELSAQLSERLPGFPAAVEAARAAAERSRLEVDVFEIEIIRPLARLAGGGGRITLVLDGLDHPEEGIRQLLVAAVADLTNRPELAHVRVIVGIRQGTGVEDDPALAHMHRITVAEPDTADIATIVESAREDRAVLDRSGWVGWIDDLLSRPPEDAAAHPDSRAVAGGWLLARLLMEVVSDITAGQIADGVGLDGVVALRIEEALSAAAPETVAAVGPLLGVLVAAGVGPVLPLGLLAAAMITLGAELDVARIRDLTVSLGVLVTRNRPGTAREALGVAHAALLPALIAETTRLGVDSMDAHHAISRAIEESTDEQAAGYARSSGARHYLAYGDSGAALRFLETLETPRAADNRDLWAAWLPSFADAVGAEHPDTLRARSNLVRWRGDSGDLAGAIAEAEKLLAEQLRALGPADPATLALRNNLAWFRGESGDLRGAIAEFERLLADQQRVFEPGHPDLFRTRSNLAYCRADGGDLAGALEAFEELHADQLAALGADHPDTLGARDNVATCRAEIGDLPGAIAEYERLLADRIRVLGPQHPASLDTRNSLAWCRARSGDLRGAVAEFERLLADRLRVLGPDHPDTLMTRDHLASARGESGDLAGAVAEFESLLADRLRVLGADHPATLGTRGGLAWYRAGSGDYTTAVAEFEQLLPDQLRVIGPDHPASLVIRNNLAAVRSNFGDFAGARAEFERLLADRLRVLGPDHPDTLVTRSNIAFCRARSGDPGGAVTEFQQVLVDQRRVLGPDHPGILITRNNLALYRGEDGDFATAISELTQLLVDMRRVLGPDHPDILEARHNLLSFRLRSGDTAGAAAELERLIADKVRALGADHPGTLITRSILAKYRADNGDSSTAIAEFEQLLADRLRVLGPDHPATLDTRHQLALLRGRCGDPAGAVTELEQLLAARIRLAGGADPAALTVHNDLAHWRAESGDLPGALADFEHLCTGLRELLGPDHPATLGARTNLAHTRAESGDISTALAEYTALLTDQTRILGPRHPITDETRDALEYWRSRK